MTYMEQKDEIASDHIEIDVKGGNQSKYNG